MKPFDSAYILAGGKSSRMGTDKGLLTLEDKPMVEWIADVLKPLFSTIYILTSHPGYQYLGLEMLPDTYQNSGPAAGIETMLRHTQSNLNFLVSCDTPFITKEAISYLMEHAIYHEITIAGFHGKWHPLMGVYHRNIHKNWEQLLKAGNLKIIELIQHFKLNVINTEGLPEFTEKMFYNLNTPEDIERIKSMR